MIYTERKVSIKNDIATIDSPIILFRGDREVDIMFTIVDSKFKFESNKGNVIDKTQASFGQLAVDLPDGTDLFTEIVECENGVVVFSITGEMIDEIHEVGFYSFHIRLYNDDKTSRITLPPVMKGIEIREPLIIEGDVINTDLVGDGTVGYSMVQTVGSDEEVFDEDGNYIPTSWSIGDKITAEKLNKIEEGIEVANTNAIGGEVDLSAYATKNYVDSEIDKIELTPGPQGPKGEQGPEGPQGPKGDDGYTPIKGVDYFTTDDKEEMLSGYATESFVSESIANAQLGGDGEVLVVEIKDANYTLTTQPRQYAIISGLSELVMPEVNDFTEIHLYFNVTDGAYVIFPEGMYKNNIEPQHTNSYELVCVYNTKEWIFEIIEYTKRSNDPEWFNMTIDDSGELVSSTEYITSEFITINPKLDIKIISANTDEIRLYFYDENKQYIGRLGHQPDSLISKNSTLYPMPTIEGAKYFRYRTDLTEGITMDTVNENIQIVRVKKVADNLVPMQFRFNRTTNDAGKDMASDDKFILNNLYLENYYKYAIEFYADDSYINFYDSNQRFISRYKVSDGYISIDTDAEFIPQRTKYICLRANMVSTDASRDTITPENVQDFVKVTRELQPSSNDIELDWLDNYSLSSSSGDLLANDACCTSNYITIDDVYDYCLTINPINTGFRIYEYDADKNFLRRSDDSACFYKFNERLSFGENTKYIRLKASKKEYSFEEVVDSVGLKRVQKDEGLLYSFGLISDVHIDNNHDGDGSDVALSDEDYMNALRFFEEEGANFIAYCGDMVNSKGSDEQDYIRIAECLETSKLPNYVIKGNHDRSGSTEYFDTYVSPASFYQVNYGDDILVFISSSADTHAGGGMTQGRVNLVKDTITNNPNQRIFIFQHYFFRGYGSGDGNGGIYGGTSIGDGTREEHPLAYEFMDTVIASPNVISCHGHSHCEFSIQDTCSHANMYHADGKCWDVHVPSCARPRYLNANGSLVSGSGASEGYIVKVYEDKIIFKALDLATNEYLPQYDQTVLLSSQPKEYSYIEDGLKLYIDADHATTEQEIRDISGNETPLSVVGLSVPTDGYLVFDDDIENYINCNFTPDTSAWTAEFYGKLLYTTSTQYLFSYGGSGAKLGIKITLKGGSVNLRYGGDDIDILDIPGVAQKDLEYLLKNTTHKDDIHIIVSYDGSTLYVFINGVLIIDMDKSPVDFSSYNNRFLYIGKHYEAMDDYPRMNLKLFRWYDGTALTPYQAFQNYLSVIKK